MSDLDILAVSPRWLLYMDDFKMVPAMCQDEQEGLLGPLARSARQDFLRANRRNVLEWQVRGQGVKERWAVTGFHPIKESVLAQ